VELATAIAVLPIVALNVIHLGRVSPSTSLYTGWQLYLGANVETVGRWNAADWERVYALVPGSRVSLSRQYAQGEFDADGLRIAAARDDAALVLYRERIARVGLGFVAMMPAKFVSGWGGAFDAAGWVFPLAADGSAPFERLAARATSQVAWVALLLLAAVGQLTAGRRIRPLALVTTSIVVPITASLLLLETKGRYHEYAVPVLAGLAAIALWRGTGLVLRRIPTRSAPADTPQAGSLQPGEQAER
jgi:hypothetical protein